MSSETEGRYRELGVLVANVPDLSRPDDPVAARWLGRAAALVAETSDLSDRANFNMAASRSNAPFYRTQLLVILYRALARAERDAPVEARGAYIAAGAAFDGLMNLRKVIERAEVELLFVDAYAGAVVLDQFATLARERVMIRILTAEEKLKANLQPAVTAWREQHGGARPLEVRLTPPTALHDRWVILDGKEAWSVGTSFNSIGGNSSTALQRADPLDVLPDVLASFRDLWSAGRAI